ncbi:hypothetical protein Lal_00010289 [Lupinus albus]|nr:hypothetical protein Lal_00010289 [Lupinus albus]
MGKKYKIEIHSDKLHGIRAKGSAEMIIEEEAAVGGSMHGYSNSANLCTYPQQPHLAVVCCIICYLMGTSHHGLFFPDGSTLKLLGYSDAYWASFPDTQRSVTGWCILLDPALISWKNKKQATVSKYQVMFTACFEITWMCGLLAELGFQQSYPTHLVHNASAIQVATNPVFHEHAKHIKVDYHYLQNFCQSCYFPSTCPLRASTSRCLYKAVPHLCHQFLTILILLGSSLLCSATTS